MNLNNNTQESRPVINKVVNVLWFEERMSVSYSLFKGSMDGDQTHVKFELENNNHKWDEYVFLDCVEREDGSGEYFNFKGRTLANKCKVNIFVNFRTKKGKMTFLK